jgi:hypothetical protein
MSDYFYSPGILIHYAKMDATSNPDRFARLGFLYVALALEENA